MPVHTDAPGFARDLLGSAGETEPARDVEPAPELRPLLDAFFAGPAPVRTLPRADPFWRHAVVSGHSAGSQYERLIGLVRQGVEVPHGVACIARSGSGFLGFRGRSWVGCPGNIHLSVHLAPHRPIERFESVFMALAAVSVVDAIDGIPGLRGRAGIKWVNDVVVEGAKVAGVLAHTQTRGATVTSVVLGVGVNVETAPAVPPTPFVPAAAALRDLAPGPTKVELRPVLLAVLRALEANYRLLLAEGYRPLVERYRARSVVIGREVQISSDDADGVPRIREAGRVSRIGDGLELWLEGRAEPVVRGRLILAPPHPARRVPRTDEAGEPRTQTHAVT